MNNFVYQRKTELVFGQDMLEKLPTEIKKYGNKVLLTYGMSSIKRNGLYDQVVTLLNDNNIEFIELSGIKPNPEVTTVREGVKLINEHNIDFILAVGGGSVIDNSKHMILAQACKQDIWDLILDPSKAKTESKFIPLGTILTISATGSEMNCGGVVTNPETCDKMSIGHPELAPVFSFLDPNQLTTLPPKQRVAGLADTLSHLLENYFTSHNDEGFPDRMAEAMMLNLINYGSDYLSKPDNYESNAQVMLSATYALNGVTGLGKKGGEWSVHSIEHDLSAVTDITHGIGLALIHPYVLDVFLNKDIEQGLSLIKFVNIGKNVFHLTGTDEEVAVKANQCLKDTFFGWIEKTKLVDYDIIDFDFDTSINKLIDTKQTNDIYHEFTKADLLYIYTSLS
ncbi:iron-containing alcohol dehydrogenase [Mycoplasma sp. P36-A1]|uniref:iron-containing alcohol dehydrogenase n=1 Tax=Mycoplasma sp. P36-A1 TaxID=3252900 RepID=UPI003C2CFCC5